MNKILVVDDEQDICDIIVFNLRTEGFEAQSVNSAEEALRVIEGKSFSPDLLLLDVMMGAMSGFELASKLKADAKTADLPIIFLTAKATMP